MTPLFSSRSRECIKRIKIMTDFNAFLVEGLLLLLSKKYFHHDEPLDVSTYFMTDDIR